MKQYIMVIDEGTTGTRAIIFDDNFQPIAQSYDEFIQYTPNENMVEHDAMMRWKSMKKVLKCAKTRLKKLLYRLPIFVVLESQTRETPLCYGIKKQGSRFIML